MPSLVEPTVAVRKSFLAAMREFADEGRDGDDTMIGRDLARWGDRWETDGGFAAFVATVVRQREEDAAREPGRVPCTTLWWIDETTYLGRIAIRHQLTPALREIGGHIGYDVRHSERRRGHGTAMLAAALPVAHSLGIDPALVTCDDINVGSRRVIEANGGVFEDQRGAKLRFWVPTSRCIPLHGAGSMGARTHDLTDYERTHRHRNPPLPATTVARPTPSDASDPTGSRDFAPRTAPRRSAKQSG